MKKYNSADLRVINLRANDIVTASGEVGNTPVDDAWSAPERYGRYREDYDLY